MNDAARFPATRPSTSSGTVGGAVDRTERGCRGALALRSFFLFAFLVSHSAFSASFGPASPLLLQELLATHARSGVGGELAIAVYSQRFQRFEAERNAAAPFTPASTLKLVVTAAALDAIPEDDAPHTTLEIAGQLRGRTLRGELRLLGGGDPNISDRFYPDGVTPLLAWADSLKAIGIDTIRGRVTAIDSFFTGPHRPSAWAPRHFGTWYGAEISALSFNDNCFEITVGPGRKAGARPEVSISPDVGYVKVIQRARTTSRGGNRIGATLRDGETTVILSGRAGARAGTRTWLLPVRNPPEYFRAGFLTALRKRGIVFIPDADAPSGIKAPLVRSLRFSAAPLASLIDEVNQRSQNLHAEMLLRHLGRKVMGEGSDRAGIAAEYAFLDRLGIDTAAFELHDASGLSHRNRVEARGMAQLLARMARHPAGPDYIASLAQPGLDGATGKRLRAYAGQGLVRYKTGTLNDVSALAGYAFGADGDTLSMVFILNGRNGGDAPSLLDSLYMQAARWFNKERPAVAEAHRLLSAPGAPDAYAARLRHFSRALIDAPYFLGPTGEGRHADADPLPIADLARMDCVTYIENVVGLARARRAPDFVPALLPFRYHGDTVAFAHRNHYFVGEWLANNPRDFRPLALPGDTVVQKALARSKLLAAKGVDGADVPATLRYLPYEKALKLARNWTMGDRILGVAFMTRLEGLDATHTGFVDARPDLNGGRPILRHAGQLLGRVGEQDFAEYLESRRGKCAGVLLFEFLPPPGGT